MEKKYLTLKEKICFPLSAFGRSGIYTIMTMFYLVFLVDVAKLNAVTASAIILGGRIFDALNDPIMGMIVDKTRSKWGKMRPYLLFSPIPVCVSTILLFIAPFQSSAAATVYAACTYVLWGVCFTIQDVPFWGLTSVITPNEKERTQFIFKRTFGFYFRWYSSGTSYSYLTTVFSRIARRLSFRRNSLWCHGRASFKSCVLYY